MVLIIKRARANPPATAKAAKAASKQKRSTPTPRTTINMMTSRLMLQKRATMSQAKKPQQPLQNTEKSLRTLTTKATPPATIRATKTSTLRKEKTAALPTITSKKKSTIQLPLRTATAGGSLRSRTCPPSQSISRNNSVIKKLNF